MELAREGHVRVPVSGRTHGRVPAAHVAKLPPAIEDAWIGRRQNGWIGPESRREGRWVPPLVLLVLSRARAAELTWVPEQVHTAVDSVTRTVDGHRYATLEIPVLSHLPIAQNDTADLVPRHQCLMF